MYQNNKVVKGVSLTPELWERIERVKSPELNRSAFIGLAVEEYIKRHTLELP